MDQIKENIELQYIDINEFKENIYSQYEEIFPKEERKPLKKILKLITENKEFKDYIN